MRHLKRLIHANSLVSILLLLVFAYLSYDRFHEAELRENNANMDRCLLTFWELLKHKGEGFSIRDGKLLAGSYVINGNFEVPDKIQEIFGGTATVFMEDQRVSTNVLREDGTRAVGTRLEGVAYDAVFRQGKAFRGETHILGIPYFTAYDPIRDSTGKIIGALYVGMKKSEFLAHHTPVKIQIILLLSGMSAAFIIFMILFSRLVKNAESNLLESRQKLADIIQFFPDATLVTDKEGKVTAWNRAMEELTGVKSEEMLGKGEYEYALPFYGKRRPILIDLVSQPAEETEKLYPLIERQGKSLFGEAYIENMLGQQIFMHGSAALLCNSSGEIIGAIESIRDISARKKAEESLAEKERMLTGILDGIQDGICMLDEDLRIVRVNPFFERYYADKMPFLGQKCHEVFWSRTEPCEDCPSIRTLQSGKRSSMVFSDSQSGEVAWFELESFPLLDPEKSRVTGVVEYVREITGRKQMEERAAYLASFPQLNPNPILEVDSAGKVTFFNPAAQNILETLGRNKDFTVFFPADIQQILENLDKHEELTFCRELRIQDRVFFEDINLAPQFFAGARFFIRDISDRRLVEEEVIALNAELERKVDSKTRQLLEAQEALVRREKLSILGQLSGSVGHELRNPLGVISNAVYFLKMVLTEADETTKEYLDIIKYEIDNSQRIISDLLDFARTRIPETKAVTTRQLIAESLGKCVIPEKVVLQSEVPDTLPLLKVDPLQMAQVFQNLITNAVQAMPSGGTLRIAASSKLKSQNSELDGNFIEISVSDTGEGISPENMKKLFQPLYTTKANGIGLGLVVCKNLVEANGGGIKAESELGKWTTFTVTLPVEKAKS